LDTEGLAEGDDVNVEVGKIVGLIAIVDEDVGLIG